MSPASFACQVTHHPHCCAAFFANLGPFLSTSPYGSHRRATRPVKAAGKVVCPVRVQESLEEGEPQAVCATKRSTCGFARGRRDWRQTESNKRGFEADEPRWKRSYWCQSEEAKCCNRSCSSKEVVHRPRERGKEILGQTQVRSLFFLFCFAWVTLRPGVWAPRPRTPCFDPRTTCSADLALFCLLYTPATARRQVQLPSSLSPLTSSLLTLLQQPCRPPRADSPPLIYLRLIHRKAREASSIGLLPGSGPKNDLP